MPIQASPRSRIRAPFLFAAALLCSLTAPLWTSAQDGSLDPTFDPGTGCQEFGISGGINAIAVLPDGKLMVAGTFVKYDRTGKNNLVRLNVDGSLDPSFTWEADLADFINQISLQADGKILIAGQFNSYNNEPPDRIERLNSDGSVDPTFDTGSGPDDRVNSVYQQTDGKIIITGDFLSVNGTESPDVARLNTDGSVDPSYSTGTGFNSYVYDPILLSDDKLLVTGYSTEYAGHPVTGVARLNMDGSYDVSFTPQAMSPNGTGGRCLAEQADGRILLGGAFDAYGGVPRSNLARLFPDGTLDPSFDPGVGPNNTVKAVAVAPDGKIFVIGDFDEWNNQPCGGLVRLNVDGSLDSSFLGGSGPDDVVWALTQDGEDRILIGGRFLNFDGTPRNHIARLTNNGALDPSFTTNPGPATGFIQAAVRDAEGRFVLGGAITEYDGTPTPNIARVLPDGSLDPTFDPGGGPDAPLRSMVLQPDGRILVAGGFSEYDGVPRARIARIMADGALDPSFDPGSGVSGSSYSIFGLALQPDGKVIAGGLFTYFDGVPAPRIVRLNSDGSVDPTFQAGTGADNTIEVVVAQDDGKVMVGGYLSAFNGYPRGKVVRLNADGSVDTGFGNTAGANERVFSIIQLADGGYLIAGFFTEYDGVPCGGIARLLPNGALDPSFAVGTGGNDDVYQVVQLSDQRFVAVGSFSEFDGIPRRRIVRLAPDGSVDTDFDPGEGANSTAYGLVPQDDGDLLLFGAMTYYEGASRNNVLRVRNTLLTAVEEHDRDVQPFAYPNPATGRVQLREVSGAQRVHVADATGRLCLDLPFTRELDLTGLAKGAYLITALDRTGVIVRRQRQLLD